MGPGGTARGSTGGRARTATAPTTRAIVPASPPIPDPRIVRSMGGGARELRFPQLGQGFLPRGLEFVPAPPNR